MAKGTCPNAVTIKATSKLCKHYICKWTEKNCVCQVLGNVIDEYYIPSYENCPGYLVLGKKKADKDETSQGEAK